jgi:hypothetical protein
MPGSADKVYAVCPNLTRAGHDEPVSGRAPVLLTARNEAFRSEKQYFAISPRAGVPDPILVLVLDAMLDGLAHRTQAERLPNDEAV